MATGNPTTDIYPLLAKSLTRNLTDAYKELPGKWQTMVHGNTTTRRFEDSMTWIGRGLPVARDPREGLTYDGVRPNFSTRILMGGYTQADCLAEEDIMDDQWGMLTRWAAARGGEFAVAWRTLEEVQVFNYLAVTAFATAPVSGSPDGQPYASNSHPMSAADTTTTFDNLLAADLSPTSFRQAIVMLQKQLRPNGITFMYNEPSKLLVNPDNYEMAIRLVRNDFEVDSADRNINVDKGACQIISTPYFKLAGTLGAAASPVLYNGWVLQGKTHFFEWYWREKPIFREWADENIRSRVYASHARFGLAHEDPRGMIFGSGT